ncbi:uncharacterized protein LOC111703699, partial [Eurytemora carolleeae]|uniref:uncharacterized protein LOC111703699 n=1 Tax=Eurytemora carolleeae TaxID=1294199 RepID=UPI000C762DC0
MEDHSRSCGNSSIPSGDHSRSCEDRSQPLGDHLRSSGDPSISSFSLLTDSKPDIQRRPEADISLISPSSSRERGVDGERINDAREMDDKPLVEPREGDGRSICCKDIEAEVKIAYLSCPKAKLRYECPLCKQSLGPNKTCYSTHLQLHSSSSAKACRLCYQGIHQF